MNYNKKTANDSKSQCSSSSEYFSKTFKKPSLAIFDEESESILEPLCDFDLSILTNENNCSSFVTSKSAGPHRIPPILFKNCGKRLCKSLGRNFGKVKQTGIYTATWKQAIFKPTFKTTFKVRRGKLQTGFLIVHCGSEVFESILFNALNDYPLPIFGHSQFGFRRERPFRMSNGHLYSRFYNASANLFLRMLLWWKTNTQRSSARI